MFHCCLLSEFCETSGPRKSLKSHTSLFAYFIFDLTGSSAFDRKVNSNVLSDLRRAEIADAENAAFGFRGTFPH